MLFLKAHQHLRLMERKKNLIGNLPSHMRDNPWFKT